MVSDICGICPLTQRWYKLLNVTLLHKDNLFWQLHSQHPSTDLLHFWIHKLPTNHVIGIRIAWTYLIPSETNLFKLFCVPSAWTSSGCTGSRTQKRSIQWKQHWCCLSATLTIFSLLIYECLPKAVQQFPLRCYLQKIVFLSAISSLIYECLPKVSW